MNRRKRIEMSKKHYFVDDLLGRKQYADFLYSIIVNSEIYKRLDESDAYVIAIDSQWGSGKTFFLDMFENYVHGYIANDKKIEDFEQKVEVIRYNAWENDFWKDAFEPLIYNIANDIVLEEQQMMNEDNKILERIKAASFAVIKGYALTKIKKMYGEEVAELAEKGTDAFLQQGEKVFKEYNELRSAVLDLKEALHDYINLNKKRKLLIIIDELDRCRPSFAIETLEVVKHLFDVEGIIFIFAVDIEQLSSSVKSVYGEGINAYGYMGRFFDYISKMPPVEAEEYVKIKLLKEIEWKTEIEGKVAQIVEFVNVWWKIMNFSLRELDTILENIKIMIKYFLYKYNNINAYYIYIFFLMLKYKHLEVFNDIFEYRKKPEIVTEIFEINKMWKDRLSILSRFWNKVALKDQIFDFYEFDNENEFFSGYFLKKEKNGIIVLTPDRREEKYEYNVYSLSHVLFNADIDRWPEIQNKTLPQYILERLEMFQFNGEVFSDNT